MAQLKLCSGFCTCSVAWGSKPYVGGKFLHGLGYNYSRHLLLPPFRLPIFLNLCISNSVLSARMHPLSRPWAVILLSLISRLVLSDGPASCYYFDGSIGPYHEPCIPASQRNLTTHSTCCILGNPVGNDIDICTTQGLCFAQNSTSSQATLYQGGCTDRTFEDPICNSPSRHLTNGGFMKLSFSL